ncbi:MAG: Amuc_1102 family pilus-like protein, partial [Verrucomicrobiales bacterium]
MNKLLPFFATVALFASTAQAQQQPLQLKLGDVTIGKLVPEAQKTPFFEAGLVKVKDVPNPRDWLELEAEFEVKGPRDAVVKELLFRYYIGFKDQSGQSITLTGDVKHINVLVGEKTFSAVYVAPNTLGELTGDFRRFQPT